MLARQTDTRWCKIISSDKIRDQNRCYRITCVIITLSSKQRRCEDLNVIQEEMFKLLQESQAEHMAGLGNEKGHPKT